MFSVISERHGSTSAKFLTDRKLRSSGRAVCCRINNSNRDSRHSCASRSTVGIATGSTTRAIGAPNTRDQDHNVMAVRSLPPNVSMSAARRAASSVAGAAAAMPVSSISGGVLAPD